MSLTAPRGTVDLLPDAAARVRHLEDLARRRFVHAGYDEVRTPLFEDTALFRRSIGEETDIVAKEMYTFADRKGRSLTLRPENTAGIVRAYVEHKLFAQPGPAKLYYMGPMFRYERPQAGRLRQFDQIGAEVLGSAAAAHDAELAGLAYGIFADLGFTQLEVRLNSLGCPDDRAPYQEALRAYCGERDDALCPDCRRRLETNPLRVLDCKVESCQALLAAAPTPDAFICAECQQHYAQVQSMLAAARLPHVDDRTLVRGLDYYTRTVFEIHHTGLGARSALCGGGRYDGLVEQLGGPPTPAVGFSIGVVPALLAAEKEGLAVGRGATLDVLLCPLGEMTHALTQELLAAFRLAGWAADADWSGRSLKAQLKQANRRQAAFALLLGERELAQGTVQVRNLQASEQVEVSAEAVAGWLRAHGRGATTGQATDCAALWNGLRAASGTADGGEAG